MRHFIDPSQQQLTHPLRGIGFSSVQFSHSVVSDSLRPHEPQHARPPVPHQLLESTKPLSIKSVTPSNHLILCRPLLLLPSIFPSILCQKAKEHSITKGIMSKAQKSQLEGVPTGKTWENLRNKTSNHCT